MDRIFRKTASITDVVKTARVEPHMYSEKGELLRDLEEIDDENIRRASVVKPVQKASVENSSGESNGESSHKEVS